MTTIDARLKNEMNFLSSSIPNGNFIQYIKYNGLRAFVFQVNKN